MSLTKQAKTLSNHQINAVLNFLGSGRNSLRNEVIFLLSVKAGLRAKEIASLTWEMLMEGDGSLSPMIRLTNQASKGSSGRSIPTNQLLKARLDTLFVEAKNSKQFAPSDRVVKTERSDHTTPQVIVNMFQGWYANLGFVGCSSHSGRRTFVTNAAKKITSVGGSLRDVQYLAGHASLQTTERYIEYSEQAKRSIVDII